MKIPCRLFQSKLRDFLHLFLGGEEPEEDPKSTAYYENTKYEGPNLEDGSANKQPSLSRCIESCKDDDRCKFWTYRRSNEFCYLMTDKEDEKNIKGFTSGSRNSDSVGGGKSNTSDDQVFLVYL